MSRVFNLSIGIDTQYQYQCISAIVLKKQIQLFYDLFSIKILFKSVRPHWKIERSINGPKAVVCPPLVLIPECRSRTAVDWTPSDAER